MEASAPKRAWGNLLADILARGKPWYGSRSRGGALLPCDRTMPPRAGDYGAGWAGDGVEATARLSEGGHQYFNRAFHSGRAWSSVREDH